MRTSTHRATGNKFRDFASTYACVWADGCLLLKIVGLCVIYLFFSMRFIFRSRPPSPHFSSPAPAPHCLFPHAEPSLRLTHSWRWGNSMWKYVPCFASSPSLDLSCTPCSLFPPNASTKLRCTSRVFLHSSIIKMWIKGRFSTFASLLSFVKHHSLRNDTFFYCILPPSSLLLTLAIFQVLV